MRTRLGLYGCCLIFLAGCATLPAYRISPPSTPNSDAVHYINSAPPVAQAKYACGPAALESVFRHWGREINADHIGETMFPKGARGVFNFMLTQYARNQGFWTQVEEGNEEKLHAWVRKNIPPIIMLQIGPSFVPVYHFVVIKGFNDAEKIYYANTGHKETRALRAAHLKKKWRGGDYWTLIICPPEKVDWDLTAEQAVDLGVQLEKAENLPLAERWYQTAVSKDATLKTARFNLANIYSKTNRAKEAKALYQKLFEEQPGWGPASNNLAWIYYEEGNAKEAVRVIEAAFQAGAQRQPDILDTLGLAYCKLKAYEKAQSYFSEALEKCPEKNMLLRNTILDHQKNCK